MLKNQQILLQVEEQAVATISLHLCRPRGERRVWAWVVGLTGFTGLTATPPSPATNPPPAEQPCRI